MRNSLQEQCNNFIIIRDILKESFRMESCSLIHACAHIFLANHAAADLEKLKECAKIFGNGTMGFPTFRGNYKLPLICMLAISKNPQEKLNCAMDIFKRFVSNSFQSQSAALSAMILADTLSADDAEKYICRGKEIYNNMKTKYPFLIAEKDSIFAVFMAFSDKSDDEIITEAMNIYTAVKNISGHSSSVRTLSHVLSFGDGTAEEKNNKVNCLHSAMKEKGRTYGIRTELPVLGAAAMISADCSEIVNDIIEADDYLSAQKSLGDWGANSYSHRLMNAALLVVNDYSNHCSAGTMRICNNRISTASSADVNISYAVIAAILSTLTFLDEQLDTDNRSKSYDESCKQDDAEREQWRRLYRALF